MTNEFRTDVRVGITVLLGIALLLIGIAWAKSWTLTSKEFVAIAVFPTAGGLQVGDPVTINGIKLGAVKTIKLGQTSVEVAMAFTQSIDLRRDATAAISMYELMSGKKVELAPGRSPEPLPRNTIIPGVYVGDIGTLVATVSVLANSVEAVIGRTDTVFTFLNKMMDGDQLSGKINRTLDEAEKSLTAVGQAAERANKMLAEDGPAIKRTLDQADAATRDLSQALAENRPGIKMFIDSGGRAVAEGRAVLAKASILTTKIDSLLAGGGREGTLFYQLMKDPAFSRRLDSTLTSLLKLTEQLRLQGLDANIRFWNSTKPVK